MSRNATGTINLLSTPCPILIILHSYIQIRNYRWLQSLSVSVHVSRQLSQPSLYQSVISHGRKVQKEALNSVIGIIIVRNILFVILVNLTILCQCASLPEMLSKGKFATKSLKLDQPKKGDGWAKILEWNRRWNKILSVIFGILSFSLLFAIVLANILHSDYKNYEIVTTTTTTTTTSTTSSTTTTEEPIITSTVEMTTEQPSTTTVWEDTSTEFYWSSTPFYETTTVLPPIDTTTYPSFVIETEVPTIATTSTIVYDTTTIPNAPPIITWTPPLYTVTPSVYTTLPDSAIGTSSAVVPSTECDTKTCAIGYCTIVLTGCVITCADGDEDYTANMTSIINSLTQVR